MACKSVPKSIQKRYENDARKSDAKLIENGAKMEPKREPKSRKYEKVHAENAAEIWHRKGAHPGSTSEKSGGPFTTFYTHMLHTYITHIYHRHVLDT